jgi:adenine/guanine phosphoribosyltransferase-like PRPP-binding protein
MNLVIPRSPWPEGFPDVIVHNVLRARNDHPAFPAAKAGDIAASQRLVADLLSDDSLRQLAGLLQGRSPLIAPVAALESHGFNAIPDVMAQELAKRLGLAMAAYDLCQTDYVAHTKAGGWHRLATPATFIGTVARGLDYLLIDDHVGFGGTLANLRGYIEANGGRVIAMTTLTETRGGSQIAIRQQTLSVLKSKYGRDLDHFWRSVFGHGTDCLTDIEGGYLYRMESVVAIRARMADAAAAARGRGLRAAGDE